MKPKWWGPSGSPRPAHGCERPPQGAGGPAAASPELPEPGPSGPHQTSSPAPGARVPPGHTARQSGTDPRAPHPCLPRTPDSGYRGPSQTLPMPPPVFQYLFRSLGLDSVTFGYLQTTFGVLQLLGAPLFGRYRGLPLGGHRLAQARPQRGASSAAAQRGPEAQKSLAPSGWVSPATTPADAGLTDLEQGPATGPGLRQLLPGGPCWRPGPPALGALPSPPLRKPAAGAARGGLGVLAELGRRDGRQRTRTEQGRGGGQARTRSARRHVPAVPSDPTGYSHRE